MPNPTPRQKSGTDALDRRGLIRAGGAAVIAGVAGLAVADSITAPDADAAPGGPMVLGAANDAGATPTSLSSAANGGPTLTVTSTAGTAPLHLTQQPTPASLAALTSGDLANFDGQLSYTAGNAAFGPLPGVVYTEHNANHLIAIAPQRVLDTRTVAGRANIWDAAGNLDASGRLLAGRTIEISLADLQVAAAASFCNLTAVRPVAAGYMTLWPGGSRPNTSSLNFTAGAVVANYAVTGTSAIDTVSVFSSATTHVLLDVTAFAVGNPAQVNPAVRAATGLKAAPQRLAARSKGGTLPDWYAAG